MSNAAKMSPSGSRWPSHLEQPLLGLHTVVDAADWSSSTSAESEPEKQSPLSGVRTSSKLRRQLLQAAVLLFAIVLVHTALDAMQGEYKMPAELPNKMLQNEVSLKMPVGESEALALASDVYPSFSDLCNICDCTTVPPTYPAAHFISRAQAQRSDLPRLVRNAFLDIQCQQVYSTRLNSLRTMRSVTKDWSTGLVWDLSTLDLNKPTTYMFTKTVPTSTQSERNVKDNLERSAYMRRHVETIHKFQKKMETTWNGKYEDGTSAQDRQIVWIIVEDNDTIDTGLAATLSDGNINYVYFAYGPTRNFGNAQHNAALALVYHLSNSETGMLGHGPIFSADDDAEIHEDLLMYVWRVKRIGLWPMGNLGPTGFEAPVWGSDNQISGWSAGNSWRKYPLDNGAFAFNSTLLGQDLPGPRFWPTDTNGGETEFIEKVVTDKFQLEPVCKDCHVAWHNHPLNIPHVGGNVYKPGRMKRLRA
ncbi:MAG: Beta-1,3-glucuronyltransferase 2 (Glucuronosyltransferase S) [Cyphobasidiales sp. Tagirdzhanova-0007]|nr:MAG: Beta-1,3-glucuronyltransferase 2 (Glucuronosyltransferase S) [Cyphobasidiales sp. Tagirdzhanova-0007]